MQNVSGTNLKFQKGNISVLVGGNEVHLGAPAEILK